MVFVFLFMDCAFMVFNYTHDTQLLSYFKAGGVVQYTLSFVGELCGILKSGNMVA